MPLTHLSSPAANPTPMAKAESSLVPSLVFVIALIFFIASGILSARNIDMLSRDNDLITSTHRAIIALDKVVDRVRSAETAQRGYLLTDYDSFLKQFQKSSAEVDDAFDDLNAAAANEPALSAELPILHRHIDLKMAELHETMQLRQTKGAEAALALVQTDRGKNEMDAILDTAGQMRHDEAETRTQRINEIHQAERDSLVGETITSALGILLCLAVAWMVRRAAGNRRKLAWLQNGKVGLSTAVIGDQSIEQIGHSVLGFLCTYLDAQAGAFFVRDGARFTRTALFGAATDDTEIMSSFMIGEGLLGQAALEQKARYVTDMPAGYLRIGSALGRGKPTLLAFVPSVADHGVNAAFELGFMGEVNAATRELLLETASIVGIAVKSARYLSQQKELLDETQRQSEELQVQSEELRVSNEELEEQGRALRASQAQLEQQQAELHQTNAHLESQTQELSFQRDQLELARREVETKANALQQSSQYKSDFLANMSHELRTPLNSTLILAKLLGDNPKGNLTEDQIKFARTIESAGNDLLNLINDILDLSKIEAGHIEIVPDTVWLSDIADSMKRTFTPLATAKQIGFTVDVTASCPPHLITDRLRLEQILKNLAANAVKFTEQGSVTVTVDATTAGHMRFAVRDTGIGIAADQQAAIFEAFRQADGAISRKFGGTGLGLSISRRLAGLLGGRIDLVSQPGEGSTFTLTVPTQIGSKVETASPAQSPSAPATLAAPAAKPMLARPLVDDDRGHLRKDARLLMIVEDDEHFAAILRDLAHEMKFQCLVAGNAEDALALAARFSPSAIILDVGLPDHSGLMVLDRIKHDPLTRHIPIHVVSGDDYAMTARALGAIDYLQKPVQRHELATALRKLEERIDQGVRRVLIVEDDAVQRESVGQLLASRDVETVGVGTAADCLSALKDGTFDCVVLDLTLPDASGYQLLETLGREQERPLPPIIVYTGRDLSPEDEDQLRRYSQSIIIKGAKSPERLLDEVSLFLHQVVSDLSPEQRRMIEKAHNRDAILEGRTILIVEDDIRNVYALTSIFEPLGVNLRIARNGIEALKAVGGDAKSRPDLVLMDVMMPEMDGITATRKIRENPDLRRLPIIMLTAKAMKDDQERCLNAGANDYMAKPLDVDKLLSLTRVWMPR